MSMLFSSDDPADKFVVGQLLEFAYLKIEV